MRAPGSLVEFSAGAKSARRSTRPVEVLRLGAEIRKRLAVGCLVTARAMAMESQAAGIGCGVFVEHHLLLKGRHMASPTSATDSV